MAVGDLGHDAGPARPPAAHEHLDPPPASAAADFPVTGGAPPPAFDPRVSRGNRWDRAFPTDPAAPQADGSDLVDSEEPPKPRSKWRTPILVVGTIAVLAVVFVVLGGQMPSPADIWQAVLDASWGWVLVAAAAMTASVVTFSLQQRELLAAFDSRIGWRRMVAITFGGVAMTNALPAGAAVAAGYSFRQFRLSGANRSTSATVMVLSGVLSIATLVMLYFLVIGGATATSFISLVTHNIAGAIILAVLLLAAIALLVRRLMPGHAAHDATDAPTPRLDRWEQRWPRIGSLLRDGLSTARQARQIRIRYLSTSILWSVAKWIAEAVCLLAACLAFDISISLVSLAIIYLGVQLVRQIPFTPGGIGLVEASLLAGLVSAGATNGPAVAAILIYRLLSAWLLIPIGFACIAEIKRRDVKRAALAAG